MNGLDDIERAEMGGKFKKFHKKLKIPAKLLGKMGRGLRIFITLPLRPAVSRVGWLLFACPLIYLTAIRILAFASGSLAGSGYQVIEKPS